MEPTGRITIMPRTRGTNRQDNNNETSLLKYCKTCTTPNFQPPSVRFSSIQMARKIKAEINIARNNYDTEITTKKAMEQFKRVEQNLPPSKVEGCRKHFKMLQFSGTETLPEN